MDTQTRFMKEFDSDLSEDKIYSLRRNQKRKGILEDIYLLKEDNEI